MRPRLLIEKEVATLDGYAPWGSGGAGRKQAILVPSRERGQGRGSGRAGHPLKFGRAGLGRWKPDGGRGQPGRPVGLAFHPQPAGPCPDL